MALQQRIARLRLTNSSDTTAYRDFSATASVYETAAGASVTITTAREDVAGTLGAPGTATAYTVDVLIDSSSTVVKTFALGNSAGFNAAAQTFAFTADGVVASAARSGLLRLRVRMQKTDGLASSQYDVSSDNGAYGSPQTLSTGFVLQYADVGYIRGTTTAVTTLSKAAFVYGDTITATTVLGAAPYDTSRRVVVTLTGKAAVTSGAPSGATYTTALGQSDNTLPTLTLATRSTTTTFDNSTLVATPWTFAPSSTTTVDSGPNAYTGTLIGSVLPALTASFLGAAFGNSQTFDGVDRGVNSQGWNCTTGPKVTGAFTLEARVRTGATTAGDHIIAGRFSASSVVGGAQPVLFLAASGSFVIFLRTSAAVGISVTSTTTATANTNYAIAATYDGTTLRLFVNGALESSAALAGVETADNTTRFMIGRDDDASTVNGNPWLGQIDEVRLSSVARYTAAYTPATAPFASDASTIGLWHLDSIVVPYEATSTTDPRLTITRLLQLNDNVFGTPPLSKSAGTQRLTSDLGFFASRFTDAAGAGVNGITYNASLQDALALVAAITRTGVVTSTQGGQTGWGSPAAAWPDGLPTGTWNHTVTITAPSTATGLETPATSQFMLVASNPNLRLLCGGGPATAGTDTRHFTPGVPLLAGIVVFNTQTMQTVALDTSPVPAVALGRFSLTLGRAEFLDSDGVWKGTNGATLYYWPCAVSPGDPKAWTVAFTDTSAWNVSDLFIVGRAYVSGVPVSSFQKEIAVAGINNHSGYAFDGAGFVGFPTR